MADKECYYGYYWAAEEPLPARKVIVRWDDVRHRAGIQGADVGDIGPGTYVVADMREKTATHTRIIKVEGIAGGYPYHPKWIEREVAMGFDTPIKQEIWIDNGALRDADAPLVGEIKVLLSRDKIGNWSVTEL